MKLTITATVEEFDQKKYLSDVRTAIRSCFMKAGQKFLLAAIPKIPIWTGMARGAFRNLEDLVGKVTNDSQSGGVRIRTTKSTSTGNSAGRGGGTKLTPYRRGYFYKPPGGAKIERTPQAGRQFATPLEKIIDVGGATIASGKTSFYFRFDVDITYVDALDTAKWGAFKAGADAFKAYVEKNLVLPDPLKYMVRKLVK